MGLLVVIFTLFRFLRLACRHVQLGFFLVSLDLIQFPLDALNRALGAAAPVCFRRCRGIVSVSVRVAAAPLRLSISNLDLVVCLRSVPPDDAGADSSWKTDFLFLDMVTRLARRLNFSSTAASPASSMERHLPFTLVPKPPPRLALGAYCSRLAAGFLNMLVHIDVKDAACRFEDAPPHPMYSGTPGFGFAITAQVDSLSSHASRQPVIGIRSRGFHRAVRLDGFRGFYDPGIVRSGAGFVAQPVRTAASSNPDKAHVRVMDYVPDGYLPFISSPLVDVNIRLDGVSFATSLRFVFCEELVISLRDFEFQAGLASILRIPLFMSSRVALGASRNVAQGSQNLEEALGRFDTRARENYCRLYRAAVSSRMNGKAASNLLELEETMALEECLALREFAEALDLEELCKGLWDGLPTVSGETLRARLSKGFTKRLKAAEAGHGGVASNEWGVKDAEHAEPSLCLHFDFPKCLVQLRSSASSERVNARAQPRLTGDLRDMSIDVFDAVARSALVVGMEVGSFVVRNDEGARFLQCVGETSRRGSPDFGLDQRRVSLTPFMTMHFRQDGLLSPAMQALHLQMRNVHVFSIGDQLRFVLGYFVPIEAPLTYLLRRRVLKTIAAARRRKARDFGVLLPLRTFEHAAMLDIRLLDVRCHVAHDDLDAEFFAGVLDGERQRGTAPMTSTVVAGFDVLSIETVAPPSYRLNSDSEFELLCAPVGLPRDDEFVQDPADRPSDTNGCVVVGYDGRDQVAAININISGVRLDLITPTSLGHAADEGIFRYAAVDLVVVYIGSVYSPAPRTDSYLDVSFGPSGDVRLLSESLPVLVDIIRAIVDPIVELSVLLQSALYPPCGVSEEESHSVVEVNAYGTQRGGVLCSVELESWVRANCRRMVGDTHVRLRKCQLVLVHVIGGTGGLLNHREAETGQGSRRAFLTISCEECLIRSAYFASLSARHFTHLSNMRLDFSRGAASTRRLFVLPTTAVMNISQVACGPGHELRQPLVRTAVVMTLDAVQVMGQTASLGTLGDLVDLVKSVHPIADVSGVSPAGDMGDNRGVLEAQVSGQSFSEGLGENVPFVLALASQGFSPEIGLKGNEGSIGGVKRGHGVVCRFRRRGNLLEDDTKWMTLQVCDGNMQTEGVLTEDGRQVRIVDVKASSVTLWRVYGWDFRHVGFQSDSGRFLGISRRDGNCVTSPRASFFSATPPHSASGNRMPFACKRDGREISAIIHASTISLRFGGGFTSLSHSHSSNSLQNSDNSAAPGLLQFDIRGVRLSATRMEKTMVEQSGESAPEWNIDMSCSSSLSYNNLRSRPPRRVPVLAPWSTLLSATVSRRNPVVIVHGDALRVELSNDVLLQIASALRHHTVDGEDDMSYFAFVNRSHTEVSFRILGVGDESDSNFEDGPILTAARLERVPFSLPGSLLERGDSRECEGGESGGCDEKFPKCHSSLATVSRQGNNSFPREKRISVMERVRRPRRFSNIEPMIEGATPTTAMAGAAQATPRNEIGNCMAIFVDGCKPVRTFFGAIGAKTLALEPTVPGRDVNVASKSPSEVIINVVEDQMRGAMRVELLSSVSVSSHCPFSMEVFAFSKGAGDPIFCGSVAQSLGELGIAASISRDALAVQLEGSQLSERCPLHSVRGIASGSGVFLDSTMNAMESSLRDGSDNGHEVVPSRATDHIVSASRSRSFTRIVLSAEFLPGRTVFHIAPAIVFVNELRSSHIDLILDDGVPVPSGASSLRLRSRSLRGNQSHGRDLVYSAVKVPSGGEVSMVTASYRGEYRFIFRDTGGSWCEPIYFALRGDPVPNKGLFSESRRFSLGLVAVTGSYDCYSSFRISISARYVVKNRVPGLTLQVRPSANRVASAAASMAVGRGRTAAKRDFFDIQYGSNLHYDDDEGIVGVREIHAWSKRVISFPQGDDQPVTIRLASPTGPGGVQMVLEAREGGELCFLPMVEIRNTLDVAIQVRPSGSVHFGSPSSFPGNSSNLLVRPRGTGAFHQEHHNSIFDGGRSLRKVPLSIESALFERSGEIYLDEEGTFPLAVKCRHVGHSLETNADFMVIGVDVFVAERSPRRVLRILPNARYGPSFNVVNYSNQMLYLSDADDMRYPLSCVAPNNSGSSFAFSSISPTKRHTLYASVVSEGVQSAPHTVHIPSLEGTRGANRSVGQDMETVVRFSVPHLSQSGQKLGYVSMTFRFESENGFMARLRVYDFVDSSRHISKSTREELGISPSLHNGVAVHFALPKIVISVRTADSDLLSVHACGVYWNALQSAFRCRLGLDIAGLDVKNDGPSPWRKLVLTRATRGRGVDERAVVLSLTTVSRLPHTRINPSDLWHFESIRLNAQPLVVNLESKFADATVLYFSRIFSSLQFRTRGHQPVGVDVGEGLGEDTLAIWKVPLFIGTDFVVADICVNFSFEQNGRLNVGFVRAEKTRSLPSMLRTLVVNVLPPIREAQVRLRAPDLANGIYLSGQLSGKIVSHGVKQGMHVVRSLVGNVAVLNAIEIIVLGRKKGEAGLRRLGRARALMRRAANHLNSDPSPASVERVGNYKKHGLARYEANDRLAQSHTIDVLGYSIDDTRFEDNSPELV